MNKPAVMISIRPEWCKLIAEGKKTVEARKTFPRLKPPFRCYIYESRERKAVIGEFVCNGIVTVLLHPACFAGRETYFTAAITAACITKEQLKEYSGGKDVFGWSISDLVIYDHPRSISEFFVESNATHDCPPLVPMKRPPQSWCYVYGGAAQ